MRQERGMGHATHFLTRIERLSALQADLALGLYRDPGLVYFILNRVLLPDGADRVALALEHQNSPHVVVTRAGAFVTCLGAGMSVGATPVISRAQIDGLGEKFEVVRAGLARAMAGDESQRLVTLLLDGGGALAREDFALLRAIVPVMGGQLVKSARDVATRVEERRQSYRRSHFRVRASVVTDLLRHVWADVWAIGHLAALCSEYVEQLPESVPAAERVQLAWALRPVFEIALTLLTPATVLRVAWGAGRIGLPFLSQYYDRLRSATLFSEVMHVLVVLLSVGLRHADVRDEISEALQQNQARVTALDDQEMRPGERKFWALMHGHGCQILAGHKQDEYLVELRKQGAERIVALGAALPAGHPQRWDGPEQVPDDLALAALPSVEQSMLVTSMDRVLTFFALPWVAGVEADDLYLPARYMEAYGGTFDADRTRDMLDRHARYHWIGQPVQAPARPGRNQSCPCGSGKKFKRCCGAGQ
jgi:hypothetical protein